MKSLTLITTLASAVSAHMIMRNPVPAGNPHNGPISADGSDFPCQTGGGQIDTSKPNKMTIGSPNTLDFYGSATHGGGSCQVSVAKGTTVSKDTKWMVIHSIEGGCPAFNNGNQNLSPADPMGTGAATFSFTFPDHPDLGAGDYTLAWTWNNRIGNREFYMNCAYVQVGTAAKKRYAPSKPAVSRRDQAPLPAMFTAHIGNGCSIPEGFDVKYPDPGQSLEIGPGFNPHDPEGSCGATGSAPSSVTTDGSSSPSTSAAATGSAAVSTIVAPSASATGGFGSNTQSGSPQPSVSGGFATFGSPGAGHTSAAPSSPIETPSPNNGPYTQSVPNVFATGAASQSTAATSAPTVPTNTAPAATATSATSAPVGTGAPSTPVTSGATQAGAQCNPEGAWACASDGQSFQRCASGQWSVSIQMSAGMTCVPGISANFVSNPTVNKRDLKSHIARRRHNIHSPHFS